MFTRAAITKTWRDIRPYLIFSTLLFFAGVIVGGTPGNPTDWLKDQLRGVAELAEKTRNSDNPQLAFFWLILINNVTKSIMAMYLGIAGAILPLVMLVTNGMVIGFLFGAVADQGENVWLLAAKGILPHGILELPAVFLACAFGIRMGFTALGGIFGSLFGRTEPWTPFRSTLTGSVPAVILIAVMLLAAAAIESTITFWLVGA